MRSLFSLLTFGLVSSAYAVDSAAFLSSIAKVEGDSTTRIGAAGERSRWQFTPAVWYTYSTFPFHTASKTDAVSLAEQQFVAEQHLKWLMEKLPRPTVKRLAMAWNAGRGAVMRGDISAATRDYAQRVSNLYEEYVKEQPCYE